MVMYSRLWLVLAFFSSGTALGAGSSLPGDLNADYRVDFQDVTVLCGQWLGAGCSGADCPDLNGDGTVDLRDVVRLAQNWHVYSPPLTLKINELLAQNGSSYADEDGDFDDWIEVYNYGDHAINLAGFYLTDDLSAPAKWRIPGGNAAVTTIPANGYLVLWADEEQDEGPLHTNFKLSAGGEQVGLYGPDLKLIGSVVFGPQQSDRSYGRFPDGSNNLQVLGAPTPGRPNVAEPPGVVINEIMYHPYSAIGTPEDIRLEYIELYSHGASPVDMSGWRFSDGVDFTFPVGVSLLPGDFLVIAADVNAFKAKYPAVANVVGSWRGHLSNSSETITLVDSAAIVVDTVTYADQGDWADRVLGPVDHSHRGWEWQAGHNGGGRSLELINPNLPNEYGRNWASSMSDGGTPGAANSVVAGDIAPLILDVKHAPIIPRPNEQVAVTARIVDEMATGLVVALYYRVDGAAGFSKLAMVDDGAHGDGRASDGAYGIQIPAQPDGAVVEFYVEAVDAGGKVRTWPAPALVAGVPQHVTNALYQVDGSFDPQAPPVPGSQPVYYCVMTEEERAELASIGSHSNGEEDSDATMNGTFISVDGTGTELRYNVGIRNRGHGTRSGPPNNYHVSFVHCQPWQGVSGLNFNCRYTHSQIMGSAMFQMAGIAAPDTAPVQLRINGADLASAGSPMYGVYARLEAFNDDFAENHFPEDPNGNLYTCFRLDAGGDAGQAQLLYEGANPNTYRNRYFKANNEALDDWSDLIHMLDVLNNAPDATYFQDVSKVINVSQWLRYIALNSLLLNFETGLNMGIGDDYFLYCGVVDPRFVLIPHDLDTILDQGNTHGSINQSIFSVVDGVSGYNGVEGLKRFLARPEVVPLYYQAFLDLINGPFNPETLDPLFDQVVGGFATQDRIDAMKQFVRQRTAAVLAQIPQELTISTALPVVSGYPQTKTAALVLSGSADVAQTRSVLVNGRLSQWDPMTGAWRVTAQDNLLLYPGINRVVVQAFDGPQGAGRELDRRSIDIWYDDGNTAPISGTLAANRVLDAASGPWHVTAGLVVPTGRSLTIQPGTSLFFEPGAGITVQQGGRLAAQGSEYSRIRLTSVPGGAHWDGLRFDRTLEDNVLSDVDQEFGDGQGQSTAVENARLTIVNTTWAGTDSQVLAVDHPSVVVRDSVFPSIGAVEPVHGVGLSGNEYLIFDGCVFGTATGYNDIIDFSGGQRPGPILQVYNCVFFGGRGSGLVLRGADAHIEGCTFMNFHQGPDSDSTSNAIATGQDGSNASVIYATRNVFIDDDHAVLLKEGCFLYAQNNVFVDMNIAAISFGEPYRDPPRPPGKGAYLDGNIFWDNAEVFEYFFQTPPDYGPQEVAVNRSILPASWHHLGQGNLDADPLFVDAAAHNFQIKSMSPAAGAGPCGLDMGAFVPAGATICGEPEPITYRTGATLQVGGPGITYYRFSVNDPNGPWSEERPIETPIELAGLVNGKSSQVYVLGKNSAGVWQQSPAVSRQWMVDTSHRELRINEVLVDNHSAVEHEGAFPDLVELYYDGPGSMSLAGMGISDNSTQPFKYTFPACVTMQPGQYLVLFADANTTSPGIHLGFALEKLGGKICLYAKTGEMLDRVEYGLQLPDLSIGRVGYDGQWRLTVPTFGQANVAQPVGDPWQVKINEWLARGEVLFENDFIELWNPQTAPVDIGGFHITDDPLMQPGTCTLAPLTFIAGKGFAVLAADGSAAAGHIALQLSTGGEMIGLSDPNLNRIDEVLFGPQWADISQGRVPDGGSAYAFFEVPTPGVTNPFAQTVVQQIPLVPIDQAWWYRQTDAAPPADWTTAGFDDAAWPKGKALLYVETSALPAPKNTLLTIGAMTYYFRTKFTFDAEPRSVSSLELTTVVDDGAVVYLNGHDVFRIGLTTGSVDHNTPANRSVGNAAYEGPFVIPTQYLVRGENVLAAEVHQADRGSTDIVLGLSVDAAIEQVISGESYEWAHALLDGLRITEVMYNPPQGSHLEFIELQNVGSSPLDLAGVRLAGAVKFTFPQMSLGPGAFIVVVSDRAAFVSAYGAGVPVAGQYTGNLGNGGDQVILQLPLPLDAAILRFTYNDAWYPTTDGGGSSLVVTDPQARPARWSDPSQWSAVAPSPGRP